MSRPPRLVVFDLDGTLVDSRRDIADAANALLERSGAARLPEETIGRMVGEGAALLIERAFAAARVGAPPDARQQFLDIYTTCLLVHTRPYPAIPEVLTALSRDCMLAVLTNKPERATRAILDGLDLAPFFAPALVVGGDSPLGRKPAPDGLVWLLRTAGVRPSEALLVGDSMIDCRTADAAGVGICLAAYGFGFESVSRETAARARAIHAPIELLNYVMNEYG